jgi:hypothetical protein
MAKLSTNLLARKYTEAELLADLEKGYTPSGRVLKSRNVELYNKIIESWPFDREPRRYSERLYQYFTPCDEVCEYGTLMTFEYWRTGYICKPKCQCTINKKKATMMSRYGSEYALQSNALKEKFRNTLTCRYGHDNLNDAFKEKRQQTNLKRYGSKTPFESKLVREKSKQSLVSSHGVEHPFQSNQIQELVQSDKYRSKAKYTCLETYGVEHFSQRNIDDELLSKLSDKRWLTYQHHDLKKTQFQISKELEIRPMVIYNALKRNNVEIRYYNKDGYLENLWLDSFENDDMIRQYKIMFENKKWAIADGYDPTTNTVYEFLGDYWHGNPNVFSKTELHSHSGKTFGELYKKTKTKLDNYKKLGYNVVYIWESEYTETI